MAEDTLRPYDTFKYNDVVLDRPPGFTDPPKPGDLLDWYSKLMANLYGMQQNSAQQGVVTGPGARGFLGALPPRVGQFLRNMPEELYVRNVRGMANPNDAAAFTAQGPGRVGLAPGKTRIGTIEMPPNPEPDAATHEAIHALMSRKNRVPVTASSDAKITGSSPLPNAADQIAAHMSLKDPHLMDFAWRYLRDAFDPVQTAQEMAVQGMTRNILRRQMPQHPLEP